MRRRVTVYRRAAVCQAVNRQMNRRSRRKKRSLPQKILVLLGLCGCISAARQAERYGLPLPWARREVLQDQSGFSESLAVADPGSIPDYQGEVAVTLCGGMPSFSDYDVDHLEGEHYSEPDYLGRCGAAWARLDHTMMPAAERSPIGDIRPSGWHTAKYPDLIEDVFLFNRCHLIAYALTGQNGDERNLITGTRCMNIEGMLPYEIETARYLDSSDNHVLYRVTPYFVGNELVARGVEMEAWSVEDHGQGLCFHVFAYNIQPGITIDYLTGESRRS